MPLYHFNIRNDVEVDDEEGAELPDEAAAREYAIENARVLACDAIRQNGMVNLDHRLEVTDAEGKPLFEVTYREAFTVVG
jgi:hypothetical protein